MGEQKSKIWIPIVAFIVAMVVFFIPMLFFVAISAYGCQSDSDSSLSTSDMSVNNTSYQSPEHADDPVAETMAVFMERIAVDDSHGYSQQRRNGNPDYDCSSAVYFAGKAASLHLTDVPFSTFNEGAELMKAGFQHFTWSGDYRNASKELKRGDVIVNSTSHTEVYVGGGMFAAARHAYPSGIEDGQPGDQGRGDDQEIIISRYVDPGLVDVYRHDASQAVTASGDVNMPGAGSLAECNPQSASGIGIDAGDGTNANPEQAKAIAKRILPSYFPLANADKEYGCLVTIWDHESGWNLRAENPSSGAYGIPQALPASKMVSAGPDWQTNASTQIKWGLQYIKQRYQTPCGAWDSWQQKGWY